MASRLTGARWRGVYLLKRRGREAIRPTPDNIWSGHGIRWNFRLSVYDIMLSNVALGMVTPFLPVFAMALGGSNAVVGLITAIPALVNTVMYLPAASFVESQPSRLRTTINWSTAVRLSWLLIASIAFVPRPELRAPLLLAAIGIQAIPQVVTNVAWTALLGDLFPQTERAHLFSLRSMYGAAVTLVSSLAAGILLDKVKYPYNYTALFVITFICGVWALHVCSKMVERPVQPRRENRKSLWQRVKAPFADSEYGRQFGVFAMSAAMMHLGINIAVPAFAIYHVRVLNLSNSMIGAITLASGLTSVLAYPMWGRISRRSGDSVVYGVSILAFAAFPVSYGLCGTPAYLLAVQAIIGVFSAGFNFTLLNLTLTNVRPADSANGIAVFNMLMNATGIIGPPLAALVISHYGVMGAFILSSVFRLAGCVIYIGAMGAGETFKQMKEAFTPRRLLRRRRQRQVKGVL